MMEDAEEMVMTADKQMVLVEYLVPGYGGQKNFMSIERAKLGEARGKWRIVRKAKAKMKGEYETQVMTPQYAVLTRDDFDVKKNIKDKSVKKKSIAWVQDLAILGGAEISNRLVVDIGIDCGFDITLLTPSSEPILMREIFKNCDLIVLNNIWGFSEESMAIILNAIGRIPYVKYEHDHRELNRPGFSKSIFKNSKLNIFLSPMHLKNHKERLDIDGICLPLAIDVNHFRPVIGIVRKENTALVCNVRNFKKWTTLQNYVNGHQDMKFTMLAKDGMVNGNNVEIRPMVPYERMPEIYSAFEYVVHLLDGWGAGERVILEGALCGCKIIVNDRVGHTSWDRKLIDKDGFRDWLREAPYEFWRRIDQIL